MADKSKDQKSVSSGSNIRLQQAESRNRSKKRSRIGAASGDIAVGFVDFIRGHAIVSLAVGFVIATQMQVIIKQLVASFITPTFQFFFRGSLVKDTFSYHINGRTIIYSWGAFVNEVLNFLFIAVAIYLIISFFKLDKLDRQEVKDSK